MQIQYDTNYRIEGHNALVLTRFKFYFNREDHILLEQFPEDKFEVFLELSPDRFETCSDNFQHDRGGLPESMHILRFSLSKNNPQEGLEPDVPPTWETEEYSITQSMPRDNSLDPLGLIEILKTEASDAMKEASSIAQRRIGKFPSAPQYHAIEDIEYKRASKEVGD